MKRYWGKGEIKEEPSDKENFDQETKKRQRVTSVDTGEEVQRDLEGERTDVAKPMEGFW